jgi:hypothetical protein
MNRHQIVKILSRLSILFALLTISPHVSQAASGTYGCKDQCNHDESIVTRYISQATSVIQGCKDQCNHDE